MLFKVILIIMAPLDQQLFICECSAKLHLLVSSYESVDPRWRNPDIEAYREPHDLRPLDINFIYPQIILISIQNQLLIT